METHNHSTRLLVRLATRNTIDIMITEPPALSHSGSLHFHRSTLATMHMWSSQMFLMMSWQRSNAATLPPLPPQLHAHGIGISMQWQHSKLGHILQCGAQNLPHPSIV